MLTFMFWGLQEGFWYLMTFCNKYYHVPGSVSCKSSLPGRCFMISQSKMLAPCAGSRGSAKCVGVQPENLSILATGKQQPRVMHNCDDTINHSTRDCIKASCGNPEQHRIKPQMFVTAMDGLSASTLNHDGSSCTDLIFHTLLIYAAFLDFDISLRLHHQFLLFRNSASLQFSLVYPQRKTLECHLLGSLPTWK